MHSCAVQGLQRVRAIAKVHHLLHLCLVLRSGARRSRALRLRHSVLDRRLPLRRAAPHRHRAHYRPITGPALHHTSPSSLASGRRGHVGRVGCRAIALSRTGHAGMDGRTWNGCDVLSSCLLPCSERHNSVHEVASSISTNTSPGQQRHTAWIMHNRWTTIGGQITLDCCRNGGVDSRMVAKFRW